MGRKKRRQISVHVSEESMREAVRKLEICRKYKTGETLTPAEQLIYAQCREAYEEPQKRMQPQIDAIRRATRIPWQDYLIVIR